MCFTASGKSSAHMSASCRVKTFQTQKWDVKDFLKHGGKQNDAHETICIRKQTKKMIWEHQQLLHSPVKADLHAFSNHFIGHHSNPNL